MSPDGFAGEPDEVLDATGLKCPLPVLRARKAMKSLTTGGVIEVRATDPAAPKDFRAFCDMGGHEFLGEAREGEAFVLRIRKGR